jgi:AcrR family transcriptional regulator
MHVSGESTGTKAARSRKPRGRPPARANGNVHEDLLNAALKVYATVGTRGATTRRIAQEAGVNEVTLFRHFGSKDALIRQAVSSTSEEVAVARLPQHPVDPERELTEWSQLHYQFLFSIRSFIRTGMAEFAEHPEVTRAACQLPLKISSELNGYLTRLRAEGLAEGTWSVPAATSMFMGAIFADAMQRDVMPARYPYSESEAVPHYVGLFLRAIGVKAPRRRISRKPRASHARRDSRHG